jgi:integrase
MAEQIRLALQSESTTYSYRRYVAMYEAFRESTEHSEDLLLRFLVQQSSSMVATSLWTVFSHLKKYLFLECKLDLGHSARITDYLKTLAKFHKKKKAPSFTREQMFEYLRTASNQGRDLTLKLALLTGFYGGMRCCEIVALNWEDVVFAEEGVLLTIRFSKTDRAGIGSTKLLPRLEEDAISPLFYFSLYREAVADHCGRFFKNFAKW